MITKYIKGDITETELKYIAHGVNCQNVMGSGVAKALFEKFPDVKKQYHSINNEIPPTLGHIQIVRTQKKIIYNLFTQFDYGNGYRDGKRYINYSAIVDSLRKMCLLDIKGPVAIPKIGCGLAGGNWEFVEQLINDTVGDSLEIWVYHLDEETRSSKRNDLA